MSEEIFVNVQKNPPANITASGPTIFCAGGSVTLTANTGPGLSYQWYKGAALIPGATSINYVATLAGNYKCRVTKMVTGCFKNSNVINISIPCKEGELTSDNKMHIFPNPSNQKITISFDYEINPNSEFTIVDVTGKVVIAFSMTSNKIEIDITKLATGVYFVKGNLDGDLSSQIFIKE
ncbi:MAG: T9SS type A sorting domain-containing protein [Bacteroidetes bacterium]|nr:T9SS type A sorting domain-containing protein [Bacteroidota bacterium]